MMMTDRQELISRLASEARPVQQPGRLAGPVLAWLTSSLVLVTLLMFSDGSLRPTALEQLLSAPRFTLEILSGIAALVMLAICLGRSAIPALPRNTPILWLTGGLLLLWLAQTLLSVIEPALPASMLGKREHCWLQTLVYSLPPLALGILWLRRQWALQGLYSGILLGLAAGMIPTLMMQVFCMYIPLHHLSHHVLPGLLMGLAGALVGMLLLRQR